MPGCAINQGIHCWALMYPQSPTLLTNWGALVSTSYNGAAAAVGACGFFPFKN
jgi:hypothetical protein